MSRRAADGPIVARRDRGVIQGAFMLKLGRRLSWRAGRRCRLRGTCLRADHAQGRTAFRSQDRRSGMDHGADLHPSRLHDLRHAVCPRREARGQAADGRQVGGLARQADLDLHPARWPGMARRQAGDGRGLRRLHQALGRQGFDGPEAPGRGDRAQRARRQDHQDGAEAALWHGAGIARQVELERALHDAQGGGGRRCQHPDHRIDRLRPLHLQEGRVEGGREGGLRQEPQVQAAQ